MFERLQSAENRYDELNQLLSGPSVTADQDQYRKLMKEHADLCVIVGKYQEFKKLEIELHETKDMFTEQSEQDKGFCDMLKTEQKSLEERLDKLLGELKAMLMPSDPNDNRSVIMEIRAGAGGEEAALFAASLFRMYSMYAEKKRWKTEIIDSSPTEIGGYKEIIFSIEAQGAYSRLKFESGVHRVQRIPDTESSGRIHTSTVTVAVIPEVDEVEVDINPADLQIDTYRSGGAGGQHINKTESAIRITHLPTGLVVTCQDQRSQYKNKESAMKVLASRLYDQACRKQESEVTQARRSQVGTGDRSERIRTYNFPQCRVTDHRIGFSLYRINEVMEGDLDELIDILATSEKSQMNAGGENEE